MLHITEHNYDSNNLNLNLEHSSSEHLLNSTTRGQTCSILFLKDILKVPFQHFRAGLLDSMIDRRKQRKICDSKERQPDMITFVAFSVGMSHSISILIEI